MTGQLQSIVKLSLPAAMLALSAATAHAQCEGTWSASTSGFNGTVRALTTWDPDGPGPAQALLIAGGDFTTAGAVAASRIAAWNGVAWQALGSGISSEFSSVAALTVYNGELIAGGSFETAGGMKAHNIASWNGSQWRAVTSGLNGQVNALAVFKGELVAGGYFSAAGSVSTPAIARWNGSVWRTCDGGIGGDVNALAVWNDKLIIGGLFNMGAGLKNIATWSSAKLSNLDNGLNDQVNCLATLHGYLYAGGYHGLLSNAAVARYSPTNRLWESLGEGVNNTVLSFAVYNDELYIGGRFNIAQGLLVNRIVRWDEGWWRQAGDGVSSAGPVEIRAMTPFAGSLAVAGIFTEASGHAAMNWATWECLCPSDVNHDGFVNADDFDAYVVEFVSGNLPADFNHDGFVNADDFDGYVVAFEAGC